MINKSKFKILKQSKTNDARLGEIQTNHCIFHTPIFMPPGTQATVKAIGPDDLEKLGAEIILVNALHLHLRPGEDLIQYFGGVHQFMSWKRPILSDSGGFQAWSFSKRANLSKIKQEGVEFASPIDGSKHFISPEKAIEIEHKIGADIIMAFDECSPDNDDKNYIKKSMERTHRWAERSLKRHQELSEQELNLGQKSPLIFGIIQGGSFLDLRKESVKFISDLPFDGLAIGGETIGYNMPRTLEIIEELQLILPKDRPLYTMGLGANPFDIIEVVKRGIDMFDCVSPSRIARHGGLFSGKFVLKQMKKDIQDIFFESEFKDGILKIANSRFKDDKLPVDEQCDCYTCQNFSRAYLRHLYLAQEPLYLRLSTIHNLRFMINLIQVLRKNIT
ncbi:MAG: tRNA guanosine(34) transglycosylase Tgt [Candidatus Paceibacterota bacterium]|jgi:queuine tRNA-ribosyltransferase